MDCREKGHTELWSSLTLRALEEEDLEEWRLRRSVGSPGCRHCPIPQLLWLVSSWQPMAESQGVTLSELVSMDTPLP